MPIRNRYYAGPVTDHFDGTRFLNPAGEPETDRTFGDIWRWRRTAPSNVWPTAMPVTPVVPELRVQGLRVTMVGHATVLIQTGGLNLLTDPVWSQRASPVSFAGPKRINPPGVTLETLPPIDAVLLSHNHYDHLDTETLKTLVARHDPLIITPLGNDSIIHRHIPQARVYAGDWGASFALAAADGKLARVHITPALHWSSRGPRDRRMALWGGFMIEAADRLVYFAGDTGYGTGNIFRRLRAQFGPCDLAILPIGAYDPRWFMAAQHTDPEEAVQIMLDLEASVALGMHWGSFKLTDEPRDEPAQRLRADMIRRGLPPARFTAMQPADVADFETIAAALAPADLPA